MAIELGKGLYKGNTEIKQNKLTKEYYIETTYNKPHESSEIKKKNTTITMTTSYAKRYALSILEKVSEIEEMNMS